MLTMRWRSMGGRLNQKKYLYTAAVALVAIIILAILLWQSNNNKKHQQVSSVNSRAGPSSALIASDDASAAQKAINSKDYKTAINNYLEAVNSAVADGNFNQAEKLLNDAIKNVPDNQVPWVIYDDLVAVAKDKNDKNLEISNLKKAIIKAQQPNSGAPSGIVGVYQKMLKQLGAA